MDLKEEHLLGDAVSSHWYYRAKLTALKRTLRTTDLKGVLDVGAGSGFFSRALLTGSAATQATCVDPGYPDDSDEAVGGKPLMFRRAIGDSDATLVLMMDVIEHVADDRALLAEYVDKVAPGTRFVVTVPAFQGLWSNHDVFLEHYRRYTLRQLEATLTAAGLRIESGHYFYAAVFPLVVAVRLGRRLLPKPEAIGSDMRRENPLVNNLLFQASRVEAKLMHWNRLAGTSVVARAVKL